MPRLAYFVHGRGRGHASRAASIVPALRDAGHEVTVFAGGDALDLLGREAVRAIAPLVPGWTGARRFPSRLAGDLRALRELRADLVVSDGDPSGPLVARALRIPAIAIGHDLVFSRCALPTYLPRALVRKQLRGSIVNARAAAAVAVNFLPIAPARPRTWVARPTLRADLAGPTDDRGPIVAYFRDRNGDDAIRRAARLGARVICFGQALAGVPGVDARPFDPAGFAAALRAASAVIASAGSNVLAECVLLGKPVLALHARGDAEQTLNAMMITEARVGVGAVIEELTDAPVEALLRGGFARVDLARRLPDVVDATRAAIAEVLAAPR